MNVASPINPRNFYRLLALGATIALMVGMCSCSNNWYLKKAIEKNPEVFADTLRTEKIDTLILEVPKVDTLFRQVRDTLIEYKQGEVKIKYLWNTKTDSIYIEADCPDQEVITKEVVTQLPPIVIEPTFWQEARWGLALAAIFFILIALRKIT